MCTKTYAILYVIFVADKSHHVTINLHLCINLFNKHHLAQTTDIITLLFLAEGRLSFAVRETISKRILCIRG